MAHSMVFFAAPLKNDSRKKCLVEAILHCFSTNLDLLDPLECSEWVPGLGNIPQWETASSNLRESGAIVTLEVIAKSRSQDCALDCAWCVSVSNGTGSD